MESDNFVSMTNSESANDWIFSHPTKKLNLKLSGDEDIFQNNKETHKFFNQIIKVRTFGLLILYVGKNMVILNESYVSDLLVKVRNNF